MTLFYNMINLINIKNFFLLIGLFFLLLACMSEQAATTSSDSDSDNRTPLLRLATTTSTDNSGLLKAILPDFEEQYQARVEVVAVGTGQAIKLGENGDADVMLVHARAREEAFVEAGHGTKRSDVMFNDFVIVGPPSDPAGIEGLTSAKDAFEAISDAEMTFVSRGDDSGTHTKENLIWEEAGVSPNADLAWYRSLGQGMGATLTTGNEMGAYTLTDRGTFLSMQENLPNLTVLVGGATIADNQDDMLFNPYGVIPVNPEKNANIQSKLAEQFVEWLTSDETQVMISEFGREKFGQPLFYPHK